jgi:ribosomal protein S18 acetylase RimI-like enzyme
MEWIVREATRADYDGLCALLAEADALHREGAPHVFQEPEGPARERAYVEGLIADPASAILVAQAGRRLAGAVCVFLRESPPVPIMVPRRYAVIDMLVVSASLRRRGIGRTLMEGAHAWAAARGVDTVELNVWEFNQAALAFYRALGYRTESRKMSVRLEPGDSSLRT